jgi:chaperonin GroEL
MLFNFLKKKTLNENKKELESSLVYNSDIVHNVVIPKVLNKIEDILEKSYGPLGSNTLIHNNGDLPIVTKDGYTILKNLKFYESIESDIHKLILKISHNLVKTVGDGSTSAVLNAIALYKGLVPYLNEFDNRKDLIEILNIFQELISNRILNNYTRNITKENRNRVIKAVGTVANNNDIHLGNKIAELFTKIPVISNVKIVEDKFDKNVDINYNIQYGFNFSGGLASNAVLNTKNVLSINDCKIFTSYEFFKDHYDKLLSLNIKNEPIVVIADIIDKNTLNLATMDYLSKKSNIVIIRTHDLQSEYNHNEFIDLSIYLDSNIESLDNYTSEMFGYCKQVDCYPTKTVFIGGQGIQNNTEIFQKRIIDLEEEYQNTPENSIGKKGNLKLRLDKLHSVNITLSVSGRTEEERKTAIYLVEDSINAIKSTLQHGFTLGGNCITYYASNDILSYLEETSDDQIFEIYKLNSVYLPENTDVYKYILSILDEIVNSYFSTAVKGIYNNDAVSLSYILQNIENYDCKSPSVFNRINNKFESIESTSILAPVQTDIEILKASFSIVCLLLSINQTIL